MLIETVKEIQDIYLINSSISVPKDPKNKYFQEVIDWIASGGIVQPEFTDEELLQKAKDIKKLEINKQRDEAIDKDVLHTVGESDYYFQRSITAQLAWINAAQTMDDIVVNSWITASNAVVDLSKEDLISICNHIRLRDATEYFQARKRKDAVLALTTIEEVNDYDITQVYES